jgi:hypothetical protein
MDYKKLLYFVATCLTISFEEKNKQAIEKQLKELKLTENQPFWEAVVQVSTSHYVFPALFCALKREDFLKYLPQELVNYMEHVTYLNRERNEQIITQAKELNAFLLAHDISPIFIKGTGNLLAGLYSDIAERMVGDIDLLFSKKDHTKVIKLLRSYGYSDVLKVHYHIPSHRHYRRLKKEHNIAAIEIHKELLIKKYITEFNYAFVKKDVQIINGVAVLSYANKLNLSILACQINDATFYYRTISLRNAYDVFLLSKKTSAKNAVSTLTNLMHPANCFLAICYVAFNMIACLEYHKNKKTTAYLHAFKSQFIHIKKTKKRHYIIKRYLRLKGIVTTGYKSIIYKKYSVWLFHYVTDINTWKRKLKKEN